MPARYTNCVKNVMPELTITKVFGSSLSVVRSIETLSAIITRQKEYFEYTDLSLDSTY